ncbi:sensor histidine kinase [Nocardioides alkalitolerans]|uniref:sensor histidine kinase n=1 Tax=Nocardioides alkalitolerans TaxID=281714 RepID=UPI0006946D3F|nr:sensor histidine kinase [Nocardioides alkalitolerans]
MASRPEVSLTARVVLINAVVFSTGTLALVVSPASISQDIFLSEIAVLAIGLALVLLLNTLLVGGALRPLDRLVQDIDRARSTEPFERVPVPPSGLPERLALSVNDLIDRIEAGVRERKAVALTAQEAESARIAQGLHDGVGQTLTAILLDLSRLADVVGTEAGPEGDDLRDEIARIREATRVSLDEVRRTARRLRPHVLEDLGLRSAIAALTNDLFGRGDVHVERDIVAGLPHLDEAIELVVFRVAQEALTNVARHADARTVEVGLSVEVYGDGSAVELTVVDDGVGIPPDADGTGLRGMRERAALVEGSCLIERRADSAAASSPDEGGRVTGTRVHLVVPIHRPDGSAFHQEETE